MARPHLTVPGWRLASFHEPARTNGVTSVNFKREISDAVQQAITRVTKALAEEGFGSLSRIDPHSKIKEKTGKDIIATVILGACNSNLTDAAYRANSDVASPLPCNAVIREIAAGTISIDLVAPSVRVAAGPHRLAVVPYSGFCFVA